MEKKNIRQLVALLRQLGVSKVKLSENSAELYCGITEIELIPKEKRTRKSNKTQQKQTVSVKDPVISTDLPEDFLTWSTFQIEENSN